MEVSFSFMNLNYILFCLTLLVPSQAVSGTSWRCLGASAPTWGGLGTSWWLLGAILRCLGDVLEPFGEHIVAARAVLGFLEGRFGASWGTSRSFLGRFGAS